MSETPLPTNPGLGPLALRTAVSQPERTHMHMHMLHAHVEAAPTGGPTPRLLSLTLFKEDRRKKKTVVGVARFCLKRENVLKTRASNKHGRRGVGGYPAREKEEIGCHL